LDDPIPAGQMRVILTIEDTIYAQRNIDIKINTEPGRTVLDVMNEQSAKHPRAFKFTTAATNRGKQLIAINSVSNDPKHNWMWSTLRVPHGSQSVQIITAGIDQTAVNSQDRIIFRFGRV